MTAVNFCYWLQGFFEVRAASGEPGCSLSSKQAEVVQRHLALVFAHDIDPKAGGPEVQKKLDAIHWPPPTTAVAVGFNDADAIVRC